MYSKTSLSRTNIKVNISQCVCRVMNTIVKIYWLPFRNCRVLLKIILEYFLYLIEMFH